jgi:hypothetical protein
MADDDTLDTILSDPGQSDLFFGFHSLFAARTGELRAATVEQRQAVVDALHWEIVVLCDAVGAWRLPNPEVGAADVAPAHAAADVEEILGALDDRLGIRVDFPNPYPNEFGLVTSRGVVSYRAVHALYQAFRLRQLTRGYGTRILEIGAGLGRTAYYAQRLGLKTYTVIDLPMANVAQASFLGQTLGAETLVLSGEAPRAGGMRLLTPEWLLATTEMFDVVLNVDSMTEMDRALAEEYARFIQAHAKCFLSINHEANSFRVCELVGLSALFSQRFPYWVRDGYTEEVYLNLALLARAARLWTRLGDRAARAMGRPR